MKAEKAKIKAQKAKTRTDKAQKAKMKGIGSVGGARAVRAKTLGFRVCTFDRQCGGDRPRRQSMAATAQLYLGLYARVSLPLAQLGPLRALTASARALSETLGFRV